MKFPIWILIFRWGIWQAKQGSGVAIPRLGCYSIPKNQPSWHHYSSLLTSLDCFICKTLIAAMPGKSTVYRVRGEWCPWPPHELDPESQNQVRLTTSNQDLRIFSLFGKHHNCFLCSWSLLVEELDPENSTWSWIIVDPAYSASIASRFFSSFFYFHPFFIFFCEGESLLRRVKLFWFSVTHFLWQLTNQCV